MFHYGFKIQISDQEINSLNLSIQHRVAVKAKQAIFHASGSRTRYLVGTGADTLYSASGGAEDWAKKELGIKFSYLIELRPADRGNYNGFLLDEREILPTGHETFEGIKVVADAVIELLDPNRVEASTVAHVDGISKNFVYVQV